MLYERVIKTSREDRIGMNKAGEMEKTRIDRRIVEIDRRNRLK